MPRLLCVLAIVLTCAMWIACDSEARPFRASPGGMTQRAATSSIKPGGQHADTTATLESGDKSPFQDNAWAISEGKRLYENYNCVGCHSHGGGGMGPALIDDHWRYGNTPDILFETIVEGRPNGMPAFGGKIPDAQVWQIVAFVQSMNGQVPLPALPGRSDHLNGGPAENMRPAQEPVQTGHP
jgi:cytochrome c oxidase cbb3-type subunit 3